MALTDCCTLFLLLSIMLTTLNCIPVPKNDLIISGEDFLSILIGKDHGDFYPDRRGRSQHTYGNQDEHKLTQIAGKTRGHFDYFVDDDDSYYPEEIKTNAYKNEFKSTATEVPVIETTTFSVDHVYDVETTTEMETTTEAETTTATTVVETTIKNMKVISVQVSSSVEEEVKVMTKRSKSKQEKLNEKPEKHSSDLSSADTEKSNSYKHHTIVAPPDIIKDESHLLYSSIPRSRMQRKQDGSSPYQTIIHHDDQGTISFSSLNLAKNTNSQKRGSWWWYGWNYPHPTTTEKPHITSTVTTTQRIILHDLNKIPYDKLNAPVDDGQSNSHTLLGRFVPSCKQTSADTFKPHDSENNVTVKDKNFISLDNRSNETDVQANPEGDQEEDDDAKFGYVVEGRNYRKYRVEEKTADGFIVGEYGVLSHNDGSLRGVRYTADSNINPRLIHDALMKFLSL